MVIAALVVLLFLLGFGSMIMSHAHREIHQTPKKLGMATGLFIVLFTGILIVYLSGYLFAETLVGGKSPFEVGSNAVNVWLSNINGEQNKALEQCLDNLNSTLQQQAVKAASDQKQKMELELANLKEEVKTLKEKRTYSKPVIKKTYSSAANPSAKSGRKRSGSKALNDLVGYDPEKYSPEDEPILDIGD